MQEGRVRGKGEAKKGKPWDWHNPWRHEDWRGWVMKEKMAGCNGTHRLLPIKDWNLIQYCKYTHWNSFLYAILIQHFPSTFHKIDSIVRNRAPASIGNLAAKDQPQRQHFRLAMSQPLKLSLDCDLLCEAIPYIEIAKSEQRAVTKTSPHWSWKERKLVRSWSRSICPLVNTFSLFACFVTCLIMSTVQWIDLDGFVALPLQLFFP